MLIIQLTSDIISLSHVTYKYTYDWSRDELVRKSTVGKVFMWGLSLFLNGLETFQLEKMSNQSHPLFFHDHGYNGQTTILYTFR